MKKILLGAILLFSVLSCSKSDNEINHLVIFTGTTSKNGYVKINGVNKEIITTYNCKSGDKLEYYDSGYDTTTFTMQNSTTHQLETFYSTTYHSTAGYIYVDSVPVKIKTLSSGSMKLSYIIS